jgi:uncharacterized protein YceK
MSSTTPPIQTPIPPEAESIRSITKVAGILALIFGVILMIIGAAMLLHIVGVIPLIFGIIDIIIYSNCSEIIRLIEMGDYRRAREKNTHMDDNRLHSWRHNYWYSTISSVLKVRRATEIYTAT